MNVSASHIGATPNRQAALGLVVQAAPKPTVEKVGELPDVQPTRRAFEDPRGRIREQIMVEKGLDLHDMMKLTSEARIRTEAEIEGEVARRVGAQQKRLVDIRV